jgi:hypothetical protein
MVDARSSRGCEIQRSYPGVTGIGTLCRIPSLARGVGNRSFLHMESAMEKQREGQRCICYWLAGLAGYTRGLKAFVSDDIWSSSATGIIISGGLRGAAVPRAIPTIPVAQPHANPPTRPFVTSSLGCAGWLAGCITPQSSLLPTLSNFHSPASRLLYLHHCRR